MVVLQFMWKLYLDSVILNMQKLSIWLVLNGLLLVMIEIRLKDWRVLMMVIIKVIKVVGWSCGMMMYQSMCQFLVLFSCLVLICLGLMVFRLVRQRIMQQVVCGYRLVMMMFMVIQFLLFSIFIGGRLIELSRIFRMLKVGLQNQVNIRLMMIWEIMKGKKNSDLQSWILIIVWLRNSVINKFVGMVVK